MKKSTVKTRPHISIKVMESLVRRGLIGKDGDKYVQYKIVPERRIHEGRNPRPNPYVPGCYTIEEDFNPDDWPPFVINRIA